MTGKELLICGDLNDYMYSIATNLEKFFNSFFLTMFTEPPILAISRLLHKWKDETDWLD